ncbi:TPA: carbamoyltransferase HypF, partial [Legionella anisa]
MFIRRARGFLPVPIQLPYAIPPTLAVGGHLKNTFCITRGDEAFVSQHIGSLNNKATIDFFHESLNHLLRFLNVKPERIAHDLHPDFYTTQFAKSYGIPSFAIQHHHAHLASVIAEHGIQGQGLGLALDGYGYGLNGEAWGGELLLLNHDSFERLGSFYPLLQPGGDRAAREPWRMGASVLHSLGRSNEIVKRFPNCSQANLIHHLLEKKINSPSTSSCGRLFDAASALLGVQVISQYEGHAAMQLESLVTHLQIIPNGWQIKDQHFDMTPTFEQLLDLENPIIGANLFHGTLIAGLAEWIKKISREKKIDIVVLSGGCFLNQIVAEGLSKALSASGITPLLPRKLPPNDGGISLGQAWIGGIKG